MEEEEQKILKNIDEKLRWSRKKIKKMIGKKSNSENKFRRQETADSDECTEVPKS